MAMKDAKTSRVGQLFSGGREQADASSASALSGAARRLLGQALCVTPAPTTLAELHSHLRKLGAIGVGEVVFQRVSKLPGVQKRDSGALNLDRLCALAEVDRAQVKHDRGSVSETDVTCGPSSRPPPRPTPAKADHSADGKPAVAPKPPRPRPAKDAPDTQLVVTTTPKRASAWRSMRTMLRILEKEFGWPKDAGLPTWACHFVLKWSRRISYASSTLMLMKEQGLLRAPSTMPMYAGEFLWTICDVRVVTRGADVPDVPETELRAQIRHILYYHQDRIHSVRAFKGVKIPKSPK